MVVVVGLGNPGAQYERTRHNIGFVVADALAARHGFSRARSKFQGEIREGAIGNKPALIFKPQTYMNLSGQAVVELMRFYKLEADAVIVVHDELDLPFGALKVKRGGGNAGHNGLKSLSAHVGPDFHRLRLGIGRPPGAQQVADFVLSPFAKREQEYLSELVDVAMDSVEVWVAQGLDAVMRQFNNRSVVSLPPLEGSQPS